MQITIMSGVSGSGKSTYAKFLASLAPNDTKIVSADNYFVDENGDYKFDAAKLKNAHKQCYTMFLRAINSFTQHIIVDNTNTSDWEYEQYVKDGKTYGYAITRIVVDHNIHKCASVHDVPETARVAQHERLIESLKY